MASTDLTIYLTAVDHLIAPPLNVAVIGAGTAGLAAARALKIEGHRVVIYEKSDKLGGTWAYDPKVESDPLSLDPNRKIVHSSLYHSLRSNLPRQLLGFSDYPFSTEKNGDPRTFPGHQEVLQFLNEFADKFGLGELIRFRTEVIRVERVDDMRNDEWVVESRNHGSSLNELFNAVVVCNGHYTTPNVADFPGREMWPGKQIHCHNYRVPDPFEDQIDHANENGEVVFEDGAIVHADIILHRTGFMYDFPFLKIDEGILTVEERRVGPLYNHIFPPKLAPYLSFVGIPYEHIVIPMIDLQAKWMAQVLSGKARLPSMEEKGISKNRTHALHFEMDYLDWLANEVGIRGVDEISRSLMNTYLNFFIEGGKWRHRD